MDFASYKGRKAKASVEGNLLGVSGRRAGKETSDAFAADHF